jgi:hypothetical protein
VIAGWPARDTLRRYAALAGFQAGMVAVFAMLVLVGLASAWYRRTFWYVPNLMASTIYGDDAIRGGFSWESVVGIALYAIPYSLFGALFGAAIVNRLPRFRLVMVGMVAGLAWHYLWFGLLWKWLNPLIPLYTHDQPMIWGHLLFGAMLGRYPLYLERLLWKPREPRLLAPPVEPAQTPPPAEPEPAPEGDTTAG